MDAGGGLPSVPVPELRALGERLRAIGYDSLRLRSRLGRVPDRLTAGVVAAADVRAGDDDLAAAIRFWCLGLPAAEATLSARLEPTGTTALEAAGLVRRAGSSLQAAVRITPALGRLLVHDFDRGDAMAREHVVGIGPASRTLAGLTPRETVERAADIGSGSGVQALAMAGHARTVVATDINPRAGWTTLASAALNGVSVEMRLGDALEPLAGERFDLLVSNPPFVVSPRSELTFRDAPVRGDALCEAIVRAAPSHLTPGGMAVVLVNWVVPQNEPATAGAERWLSGLPVTALLLHHDVLDPVTYAQRWSMLPLDASWQDHRETLDAWVSELRRLGADHVASGAIVLEASEGPSRVQVVPMRRRPMNGGSQVRRMMRAIGRFDGPADPRLPDTRFRLVHGHRIDQRLHYGHGSYQAAAASIELDRTAGVAGTIPARLLEAVFRMDGSARLADLGDTADGSLAETALELFELGFLEIVEPAA